MISLLLTVALSAFTLTIQSPTHRVVVLDFTTPNTDVELERAQTLGELIRLELARERKLAVLERREMARLYEDRSARDKLPTVYDPLTAVDFGKVMEANFVVLGELRLIDGSDGVLVRVVDVSTTRIIASVHQRLEETTQATARSVTLEIIRQLFPPVGAATLVIDVIPASARVKLPGYPTGRIGPLRAVVPPGRYVIPIEPPDETFEGRFLEVDLAAGAVSHHRVALAKRTATLESSDAAAGALLYVNGDFRGVLRTRDRVQIPAGENVVEVVSTSGTRAVTRRYFPPATVVMVPWQLTNAELAERGMDLLVNVSQKSRQVRAAARSGSHVAIASAIEVATFARDTFLPRWQYRDSPKVHNMVGTGSHLVVAIEDMHVTQAGSYPSYALVQLDGNSGAVIWRSPDLPSLPVCVASAEDTQALVSADGRALMFLKGRIGPSDLALKGDDKSSSLAWETCNSSGESLAVLSSDRRTVHAYDLRRGEERWHRELKVRTRGIVACGGVIGIHTDSRQFMILDSQTGGVRTTFGISGDYEFLRCRRNRVVAIGANGDFLEVEDDRVRQTRLQGFENAPVTDVGFDSLGNSLLVQAGYRVIAFDDMLGTALWSHEVKGAVLAILPSEAGYVSIVTQLGHMYQFGTEAIPHASGWVTAVKGNTVERDAFGASSTDQRVLASYPTDGGRGGERVLVEPTGKLDGLPSTLRAGDLLVLPGILDLSGMPPDASCWVDDVFVGKGPRLVRNLPERRSHLRCYRPGYEPLEENVEVNRKGAVSALGAFRRSDEAVARLVTEPAGAAVFVNGEYRGQTPVTLHGLSLGEVPLLRIERWGYKPVEERFEIAESYTTRVRNLRFAQIVLSAFVFPRSATFQSPGGWAAESLQVSGPQGAPVRLPTRLWGGMRGDMVSRGVWLSGGIEAGENLLSGAIGVGFSGPQTSRGGVVRAAAVVVGLSGPPGSRAPTAGGREGPLSHLPLQYWSHPIPRVKTSSTASTFVGPRLQWQPNSWMWIEAEHLWYLSGGRLQGALLGEDSRFNLVEDPSRSYDATPVDGYRSAISVRSRLWAERLLPLALAKWIVVEVRASRYGVNYGSHLQEARFVSVGLGVAAPLSFGVDR